MLRPIKELLGGAKAVGQGDLDYRVVAPSGGNEIAQLASEFNRMAESLAEQRRAAERQTEERLSLERELRYSERLASVGRLAAGVAHEMGAPLNVIKGRVEMLRYDLQVVESGALHVYPDVYERGAFALDSLRAELQSAGVAIPLLEDKDLRRILDQVSVETQFVINVDNIRKGRWGAGRKLLLIDKSTEN